MALPSEEMQKFEEERLLKLGQVSWFLLASLVGFGVHCFKNGTPNLSHIAENSKEVLAEAKKIFDGSS